MLPKTKLNHQNKFDSTEKEPIRKFLNAFNNDLKRHIGINL